MPQILLSMFLSFISSKTAEKLALILLKKLAESTESRIDDQIYDVVKELVEPKELP